MTEDSKITYLPCLTRLDLPVDRVLDMAKEKLDTVVLLGYDKDGEEYFASTYAANSKTLWLLERLKHILMQDT